MTQNLTFQNLVDLSKTGDFSFSLEFVNGNSLKFTNHHHPWSILETEDYGFFNFKDYKTNFQLVAYSRGNVVLC